MQRRLFAGRARVERRERAVLLGFLSAEFFDHLTLEIFRVHGRRTLGELNLLVVDRTNEIVVHVGHFVIVVIVGEVLIVVSVDLVAVPLATATGRVQWIEVEIGKVVQIGQFG